MRSAAEAAEFFSRLRDILVWLGVNDGNMEEGSLRCDANVSVRPRGPADVRHEGGSEERQLVPLSSQKAIEYEIERQIEVLEGGGRVDPGDAALGFGDRPHALDAQQGRGARLPLLPRAGSAAARGRRGAHRRACARRCRSCRRRGAGGSSPQYAIPEYDAGVLTQSAALADYFEAVAAAAGNPKAASNWVMGELLRTHEGARRRRIEQVPLTARALAGLIALVDKGTISSSIAKDVFAKMYDSGRSADEIVAAEGLAQIGDESRAARHRPRRDRRATPMRSRSTGPASSRRSGFWSAR